MNEAKNRLHPDRATVPIEVITHYRRAQERHAARAMLMACALLMLLVLALGSCCHLAAQRDEAAHELAREMKMEVVTR